MAMMRSPGRPLALLALLILLLAASSAQAASPTAAGRGAPIDRALRQRIARAPGALVPVLIHRANDAAAVAAGRSARGAVRRHVRAGRALAAPVPAEIR